MNRVGDLFPAGNTIAPQLIRHYLPGLTMMCLQQTLEEPLARRTVTSHLHEHINNLAILIDCPPGIMLLSTDLHEDLIDEEGIAVALVLSLQSSGIFGTEFDAPEPN